MGTLFSVVYFSRGTLPQKSWSKGATGGPRPSFKPSKPPIGGKQSEDEAKMAVVKTVLGYHFGFFFR